MIGVTQWDTRSLDYSSYSDYTGIVEQKRATHHHLGSRVSGLGRLSRHAYVNSIEETAVICSKLPYMPGPLGPIRAPSKAPKP